MFEDNKAEDLTRRKVPPDGSDVDEAPPDDELDQSQTQLLEQAAELRETRSEALDRLRVVLDEYEAKGGDPEVAEDHAVHARAVGGVKVDVSDSNAVTTIAILPG